MVKSDALPDVFLKVVEVKKLLASGNISTSEAVKSVGISRSAFYKYKDSVQPFNNMQAGRIITFYAMLKDNPGVLSSILSIFATSGANILTINQSIPTNGCAAVTISAETSEMGITLEDLIARASAASGIVKFEILAG
jgi:chorismate mutase